MKKFNLLYLDNEGLITFYSYQQVMAIFFYFFNKNKKRFYRDLFSHLKQLSTALQVPCPYLGLAKHLHYHQPDGSISIQDARCYTPKDIPTLQNNLILISEDTFNEEKIIGILAHEMRHIWQENYGLYNQQQALGFLDTLTNPAEIDADGFGILYLSHQCQLSLDEAASILCPVEKKEYPDAYSIRLEFAKHLQTPR